MGRPELGMVFSSAGWCGVFGGGPDQPRGTEAEWGQEETGARKALCDEGAAGVAGQAERKPPAHKVARGVLTKSSSGRGRCGCPTAVGRREGRGGEEPGQARPRPHLLPRPEAAAPDPRQAATPFSPSGLSRDVLPAGASTPPPPLSPDFTVLLTLWHHLGHLSLSSLRPACLHGGKFQKAGLFVCFVHLLCLGALAAFPRCSGGICWMDGWNKVAFSDPPVWEKASRAIPTPFPGPASPSSPQFRLQQPIRPPVATPTPDRLFSPGTSLAPFHPFVGLNLKAAALTLTVGHTPWHHYLVWLLRTVRDWDTPSPLGGAITWRFSSFSQ